MNELKPAHSRKIPASSASFLYRFGVEGTLVKANVILRTPGELQLPSLAVEHFELVEVDISASPVESDRLRLLLARIPKVRLDHDGLRPILDEVELMRVDVAMVVCLLNLLANREVVVQNVTCMVTLMHESHEPLSSHIRYPEVLDIAVAEHGRSAPDQFSIIRVDRRPDPAIVSRLFGLPESLVGSEKPVPRGEAGFVVDLYVPLRRLDVRTCHVVEQPKIFLSSGLGRVGEGEYAQ